MKLHRGNSAPTFSVVATTAIGQSTKTFQVHIVEWMAGRPQAASQL